MTIPSNTNQATDITTPMTTLEALVNDMCFCKLRTHCPDKSSADCLKNHNVYREFMLQHQTNSTMR